MMSTNSPEFQRNYGFWNEAEQQALMNSAVAIAGVGGDGFQLGLKLARMGVARIDVADPEVFERENINRVPGATQSTLGRLKVDVFAEMVHDINPDASVRVFPDGINQENVEDFMHRADLVFDETEFTKPELGTMVSDTARRRGIPNTLVLNVGWGSQVTSFKPHGKHSFRTLMGIPADMPLDEVAEQKLDLSTCLPSLPTYVDIRTLAAVQNEDDAPLPSIAPGVDIASAFGAVEAFLHLTSGVSKHRREPVWAPRIAHIDPMGLEVKITRAPRLEFMKRGLILTARERLGINPRASFTKEDRDRRKEAFSEESTT